MRKGPLAAMAALLVLSLALLIGAHLAVNSRRDQVDWNVTVLEGDLSAAQGVTAAIRLQDREGNLFWDTALTIGSEGYETDTDFTFLQEPPPYEGIDREPYLSTFDLNYTQGWTWGVALEPEDQTLVEQGDARPMEEFPDIPWRAVRDVASRVEPSGEEVEIVDLSDYYDQYPLFLTEYVEDERVGGPRYSGPLTRALAPTLGPVPEDTLLEIRVEKAEDGLLESVDVDEHVEEDGSTESLWPVIRSLPWDDGFLVCAWMESGRGRVSLPAEEPLGQGICYLSTEGDGELTLCLPFDLSRTEILDMELDSEGQLLVWTCEEDTLFLTVADPDTGAVRQRLELLETKNPGLRLIHQGENCLLVVSFDDEGRFCLLERQEGAYKLVLRDRLLSESVEDPCYPVEFQLFLCGTSVLWDGERMIWTLGEGAPEPEYGGLSKPIPLAVYDRTGRRCLAVLDNSLGRERVWVKDTYRFRDEDPVALDWTNAERPGVNQA